LFEFDERDGKKRVEQGNNDRYFYMGDSGGWGVGGKEYEGFIRFHASPSRPSGSSLKTRNVDEDVRSLKIVTIKRSNEIFVAS